jgi:hypothetical protein
VRSIRNRFIMGISIVAASAVMLSSVGCKSYWIDTSVENQSGQAVRELEVDYPTASFGTNGLAPGATMHYRFQIRGSGPVKVEYISSDEKLPNKLVRAQGLTLAEHQHGQLLIRLLPLGKVEFVPSLLPAS